MAHKKELHGVITPPNRSSQPSPSDGFCCRHAYDRQLLVTPGNTSSANNVQAFLSNTLHRLGDKRVCLLRADSGFSDSAFLDSLEERQMHYVIALRQNQPLQRALPMHKTGGSCMTKLANLFPALN